MTARIPFLFLFLLVPLLAATGALAQDDAAREHARAEFARGVERYDAGDYRGALEAFQEAYRVAPHPSVRVNMANCYEQLGRPLEAMFHFERFLEESEDARPAQRREVEAALERLRGSIGEVTLRIQPDGALVRIDGTETRRAPVMDPIRMEPGNHLLEIVLDGFVPVRREFIVEAGQPATVSVTLERSPAGGAEPATGIGRPEPATATAPPSASEPEATGGAVATGTSLDGRTEEPSGGLPFSTPVLIAGAATGALLIGTVVTGVLALDANADFEGSVAACDRGRGDAVACQEGYDAADRARALALVTDILLVGTIVGAGVAAYLFVTQEEPGAATERAMRPRIVPVATSNGGGVVLAGDF